MRRRERNLSLTPFPLIFTTMLEFDVFKAHDSGVVVVPKTIKIFLEDLNRGRLNSRTVKILFQEVR
jgi:hypothetical protein